MDFKRTIFSPKRGINLLAFLPTLTFLLVLAGRILLKEFVSQNHCVLVHISVNLMILIL